MLIAAQQVRLIMNSAKKQNKVRVLIFIGVGNASTLLSTRLRINASPKQVEKIVMHSFHPGFPICFMPATGAGGFCDFLPATQICKTFFQSNIGFCPAPHPVPDRPATRHQMWSWNRKIPTSTDCQKSPAKPVFLPAPVGFSIFCGLDIEKSLCLCGFIASQQHQLVKLIWEIWVKMMAIDECNGGCAAMHALLAKQPEQLLIPAARAGIGGGNHVAMQGMGWLHGL
jgi:hypothetical protein